MSAPGKVTLTQQLAGRFGMPVSGGQGAAVRPSRAPGHDGAADREERTHQAPRLRVADAGRDKDRPDAVIKVIVLDDGKVIQTWQSKARWLGPLPRRYTATRVGAGWRWDDRDGRSIKVQTDARGGGGTSVEAWAQATGDRIVVYAQAIDNVTIDAGAARDTLAPGHARDPHEAGDGGSTDRSEEGRARTEGGGAGDPARRGEVGGGGERDAGARRGAREIGSHEADAHLADAFERELGVDADADADAADPEGGGEQAGRGEAGGARDGRLGADTRRGGTGPGGEQARASGQGKGTEAGGRAAGAERGSRDGEQGGDAEGMYGGEGRHGDGGVPSAIALFGGLVSVPAALRGFVELALILSSGDVTGAGAQLFKRGLGKLVSAAAVRTAIAHEARLAAVSETKAAIERIAKDKKTASAWARATVEERNQATRIIYWELQRKYFQGYLDAAKQAKAQAGAALRRAPGAAAAQESLRAAELAEEAATVSPVAGRLPRNHEFAGKQFPVDRLPPAYRKKGAAVHRGGLRRLRAPRDDAAQRQEVRRDPIHGQPLW